MGRYVAGAALIEGVSAHILSRLLASPHVRGMLQLDRLPAWMAAELAEAQRALARAEAAYQALPVAADGSAEVELAEIVASSEQLLTVAEAAGLLELSERRVRQLAADGMGVKRGGVWLLPVELVELAKEAKRGEVPG
jgi:hypothetical protein